MKYTPQNEKKLIEYLESIKFVHVSKLLHVDTHTYLSSYIITYARSDEVTISIKGKNITIQYNAIREHGYQETPIATLSWSRLKYFEELGELINKIKERYKNAKR